MSEINSIANGTFTLGQTSAMNFQAGPGIKIDSPSAGTVRIGNDETVLWEGEKTWWADTTELTLSGNVSDYESFKVAYSDDWELNTVIKEFPGTNDTFDTGLFGAEGSNITFKTSKFSVSGNKINVNSSRTIEVNSDGNIPTKNFTTSFIRFYKIIGINRISGGNV